MPEVATTTETTTAATTTATEAAPATPELTPELQAIVSDVFGPPAKKEGDHVVAPADAKDATEEAKTDEAKTERVSPAIGAKIKAEKRAAEERRQLRTEREQHARVLQDAAEARTFLERFEEAKKSPIKFIELTGMKTRDFILQLDAEAKGKLDEVATEKPSEISPEVRALQEKIAALETARQKENDQRTKLVSAEAGRQFVSFVVDQSDAFPNLIEELTPDEMVAEGYRVLDEPSGYVDRRSGKPLTRNELYYITYGEYPDHEVVAEYLEAQVKARVEKKSAWREHVKQKRAGLPSKGQTSADPIGQPQKADKRPRTLTNGDASQRTSATAKNGWTQEQADEESIRILNQARAKAQAS